MTIEIRVSPANVGKTLEVVEGVVGEEMMGVKLEGEVQVKIHERVEMLYQILEQRTSKIDLCSTNLYVQ